MARGLSLPLQLERVIDKSTRKPLVGRKLAVRVHRSTCIGSEVDKVKDFNYHT